MIKRALLLTVLKKTKIFTLILCSACMNPTVIHNLRISRVCLIKKFPNVLPNYAKMMNPRVKYLAKCQIYFSKSKKCENSKNWYFLFSIIPPILFKLHRHTIPHFKAIEKLFWPLAWGLTLELTSFALFSKKLGNFLMRHPLCMIITE